MLLNGFAVLLFISSVFAHSRSFQSRPFFGLFAGRRGTFRAVALSLAVYLSLAGSPRAPDCRRARGGGPPAGRGGRTGGGD